MKQNSVVSTIHTILIKNHDPYPHLGLPDEKSLTWDIKGKKPEHFVLLKEVVTKISW